MVKTVVVLVLAYLLGSIPVAFLLVKGVYSRDIRRIGSHNVGAMNVARNISFGLGILTVLLDVLKGILAVVLAKYWAGTTWAIILAPILVVIGDIWPLFLAFRGGRGLATAVGALLVVKVGAAFWVVLLLSLVGILSHNGKLAAIVSFIALPFITWWQLGGFGWFFFGLLFALPILAKYLSFPKITPGLRYLSH